jgi:hypothetical protein
VSLYSQVGYESSFDVAALDISERGFKIGFGFLNEELDPRLGSFYA